MVKSALALCAIFCSGAALAAPESLSKVRTDKGEVLLEVLATGVSVTKITKISTYCDIRVSAPEKDEAAKLLKKTEQDLANGMQAAGLNSAILDFSAPSIISGDRNEFAAAAAAGAAATAVAAAGAAAAAAVGDAAINDTASNEGDYYRPRPMFNNTRRVGVSTSSATDIQAARAVMSEFGCEEDYQFVRRPLIELADPSAAKSKATTAAIATAKAQAENYAAALDMKVVRMLRVSEAGAIREFLGSESDFIMQDMRNDRDRRTPVSNEVPVSASISIDFVLEPKG
jgi:subtilisin family serine protease